MAECIVCGEKIEDGQQYCSVCAPEPHEKVESSIDAETTVSSDEQNEVQENKIEIKKDSAIIDDENSDSDDSSDSDQEDNG